LEAERLEAKLGEALIERDLLREKVAAREAVDPRCGSTPLARRKLWCMDQERGHNNPNPVRGQAMRT
jgi:hypothetical protein